MKEDLDYYEECINAKFFIHKNKILLSDLTNVPSDKEIEQKKPYEIEKFYNHFHMNFISHHLEKQEQFAINIWNKWRKNFKENFRDQNIEIQISDDGYEIILYVFRFLEKKL